MGQCCPPKPGLTLPEMVDGAKAGKLKALYVVGSNPVGALRFDPFASRKSFVVVQDMFLTETADIADVVLPAANAYEKSGTLPTPAAIFRLVKKAGEVSGCEIRFRNDRAHRRRHGLRHQQACSFRRRQSTPTWDRSRGAQSGEADRHSVWLEANDLEPKMSPFDPMAILDEIQRLVPGYEVSRMNLLAGNDQHTEYRNCGPGVAHDPDLIVPANDDLFSSGTLGRYSRTLNSVMENQHETGRDRSRSRLDCEPAY